MKREDAMTQYKIIKQRRDAIKRVAVGTRDKLNVLLDAARTRALSPIELSSLRTLTWQSRILVNMMEHLAHMAEELANKVERETDTIDPGTIEVPDFLPEDL